MAKKEAPKSVRERLHLTKENIREALLENDDPSMRSTVMHEINRKALSIPEKDRSDVYRDWGRVLEERGDYLAAENVYALGGHKGKAKEALEKAYVRGNPEKVEKRIRGLRELSSITAITTIIAGLFLLSPNITGNAIANLSSSIKSLLGIGLIGLGLVGVYFCKR